MENIILKQIKIKGEATDLYVDSKGGLYRNNTKGFCIIKPTIRRYVEYKVTYKGEYIHLSGHRLVAEYFVKGKTDELNVVHHIDGNTHNNSAENLKWVTQKQNIHESYKTMSAVRNFVSLDLFNNGHYVDSFVSIRQAANYVGEHGGSKSGFIRNKKSGAFTMIKREETTENIAS